jgi:hypothetical protein
VNFMKFLTAILFALQLAASPLEVGPISLVGYGTITNPDGSPLGGEGLGGLGFVLHASGSHGRDTVQIDTPDIEQWGPDTGQDFYLGTAGPLILDSGGGCTFWMAIPPVPICNVVIDGISGFAMFSSIGGPQGLVQVYSQPGGALLAEAHIVNTAIQVTDVTYLQHLSGSPCPTCPPGYGSFTAQFAVVDPPTNAPEPGTFFLLLVVALFVGNLDWIGRRR